MDHEALHRRARERGVNPLVLFIVRAMLTPFAGASVIVKAFAIVIIGGFGNIEGTIIAGLFVGIIESFTTQFLDPGLIDIVVFGILLATLAIRPTGLIAERREENV